MDINLLNTTPPPQEQPEDNSSLSFEELKESLNNVAALLVAAGARIETLESHVAFLLSQNPQYMNMLKIAKKRAAQNQAEQETDNDGQENAVEQK